MSQKILCFLLSICWLSSARVAWAQADFRAGYIVPLNGDTVRGLADYRGGLRNAELCRFRPAAGAEAVSYTPTQLRAYGFENGHHYRAQLLVAIDSIQYEITPPRRVFMEVLVYGPLNLYQVRSKDGVDRYFVAPAAAEASRPATELIPRRNPGSDNLTRAYLRAPLYRGVLAELMADCPAVRLEVASVPFITSALTSIVQRYNACRAPQAAGTAAPVAAVRPAARPGERVKLGVVAGFERSRFVVTGESFLATGSFATTAPVIGLGVSIPFASISEKLSLRIEALVEKQRYEDTFTGGIGYTAATYHRVQLHLTYLRVPILVRYTYPTGRVRPFAQAGASFSQRLHFDNTVQRGRANTAGVVQYDEAKPLETVVPAMVNYEIGLAGSVGVHLLPIAKHELTLELRAETGSGLIAASGINSSQQRYSALLSYNFTK